VTRKIQVLVVDDSAIVRRTLVEVLGADPEISILGAASDPYVAAEMIRQAVPDIITLDLEMPRMDGLTFLSKIMAQHPIPVVICSSLTGEGAETTIRALELGAVDIILKPRVGACQFLEENRIRLLDAVKAAARARVARPALPPLVQPKLTADAVIRKMAPDAPLRTTEKVVMVGASTGGTEAIRALLEVLPIDSPGIVIVQHMPEHFTRAFAARLDTLCDVAVREARNNDSVIPGQVLIAPGNRHTLLKRSGARYYVEVKDGPLVCRHRPSVDVLFRSAARYAGRNAVGVLLTGMGDDGARGLAELKEAGALTIAQDEATSVVFGMPKEAIKRGAVERVLPLDAIGAALLRAAW
jgi:two-component system chemotaxis response regulator CheB